MSIPYFITDVHTRGLLPRMNLHFSIKISHTWIPSPSVGVPTGHDISVKYYILWFQSPFLVCIPYFTTDVHTRGLVLRKKVNYAINISHSWIPNPSEEFGTGSDISGKYYIFWDQCPFLLSIPYITTNVHTRGLIHNEKVHFAMKISHSWILQPFGMGPKGPWHIS